MTNMRRHISHKKQSWDESPGAVPLHDVPRTAMQKRGQTSRSSLAHSSSFCMKPAKELILNSKGKDLRKGCRAINKGLRARRFATGERKDKQDTPGISSAPNYSQGGRKVMGMRLDSSRGKKSG